MAETGGAHNTPPAAAALTSLVDRVERLNSEKDEIAESIKEVFAEAKGNGFDTKALRKLVALRKRDKAKLMEENAILQLYAEALGCADLL